MLVGRCPGVDLVALSISDALVGIADVFDGQVFVGADFRDETDHAVAAHCRNSASSSKTCQTSARESSMVMRKCSVLMWAAAILSDTLSAAGSPSGARLCS